MNLFVTSTDSYGEKFSKFYNAEIENNDKGKKYTYTDTNTRVEVYVLDNRVRIKRNGEIESLQILTEEKETVFFYKTQYLRKDFKISTKKLEILEKELNLRYSIYDGEEIVNEINMLIKEI